MTRAFEFFYIVCLLKLASMAFLSIQGVFECYIQVGFKGATKSAPYFVGSASLKLSKPHRPPGSPEETGRGLWSGYWI